MKRLSCLLLGILLVFSLCACQQAAPSSGEAPDQQAITEEATEYFNQMMDGDFETFFNALPDRKSTRLNSSHPTTSRMPSSA